ncbi:MAG: hypothetical protein J2P54_10290, partial [Bradyrhizobiaceae bacterium]|nr:hypothetical protein [Bradyrhizobiaceae bacterium]
SALRQGGSKASRLLLGSAFFDLAGGVWGVGGNILIDPGARRSDRRGSSVADVHLPGCQQIGEIDLRTLDRHPAKIESCRSAAGDVNQPRRS